ncbi:MAG: group 1 glycosyl transferase, partial [Candidatus Berkelbacteria bacterium]|nr:group 1 glycosyl transferase [Candidatus Berkelbacteria bacterium]
MNNKTNNLKVAIVTEELTQLGGAERVLDCLIEMFPSAPIYTIVWDDKKTRGKYRNKDIRPSFIQKMPFGVKKYKWYLLLMPAAIEFFNLKNYDLVLSVTSALAKGVKTSNKQIHICYCNTPTRYLWFDSADYIKNAPIPKFIRPLMPAVLWFLRRWDLKASRRPNYFIANSENVRRRIKKYYNRESTPIFPPVDVTNFRPYSQVRPARSGNYYLLVSRLEPYKKVDLVIRAFQKLRLPLKIVGSGSQLTQYINSIQSETIEFVGRVDDSELAKYYQNAIATIFPQEEDAGIVPLESMACGRPVIAYAKGGAREAIVDGKTGILFNRQNISAL